MNSISVISNMPNQNMVSSQENNNTIDTRDGIKFSETFKEAINKKDLVSEESIETDDEDTIKEDSIDNKVNVEMNIYNLPIEMTREDLDYDSNLSLENQEEILVDNELDRVLVFENNLDNPDKDIELEEEKEDVDIIADDEIIDGFDLKKYEEENKKIDKKSLNIDEETPIKKEETKSEIDTKKLENKFSKTFNNLEKTSDIKEVEEDKNVNIEILDEVKNIENKDTDNIDQDTFNIYNNEHSRIFRNIPKIDSANIVQDNIQQYRKENIEIVSNSIVKLMETTQEGDTNIMKVKLYPKELGNIDVLLTMNESKLEVKILVQNQNIKDMFGDSIDKLNQSLSKQNIDLQKFSVDVNQDFNFNQSRNREDKRNNTNRHVKMISNLVDDDNFKRERPITISGGISILA